MQRVFRVGSLLALTGVGLGCQYVPKQEFVAVQNHNQALVEQTKAQTAEIENLKVHARNLSEQLLNAEGELAALEKRSNNRWADRTNDDARPAAPK